jgi:hypothetical protein
MAQELKTKTIPEIGCLWTYFGVLWIYFGVLLNAFGCPLMRADDRRCALMTVGDSGVSLINSICTHKKTPGFYPGFL